MCFMKPGTFSQFAAQTLRRELVRLNRVKFVADFERKFGALNKRAVDRARRAIRGG
jgi:hypothetical protein